MPAALSTARAARITRGAAYTGRVLAADVIDRARPGGLPTPPRDLRMIVGDFGSPLFYRIVGRTFAGYLRELCGLRPDHRVLDVGCGCGQVAAALSRRLGRDGSYEGFDIVPALTQWCAEQITPRYPRFRFRHADIRNSAYNADGSVAASEYVFPYADASFDVVFAKSVFTHLLEDDMRNYLREVGRVLKDGGRALLTFFLLDEEAERNIAAGVSAMAFQSPAGIATVVEAHNPEGAVTYREEQMREECARAGLRVLGDAKHGSWSGRPDVYRYAFQDMLVVG